jgi:hypothetical protein
MKRLAFFIAISVCFFGCTKEIPTSEVTFSVSEISTDAPTFGIEYTSDQAGSTAVASRDGNYYTSGKIVLKQGQFISLKTTCSAPLYQLRLNIFINGNLWKTGEMNNPTSSFTLSGEIPSE